MINSTSQKILTKQDLIEYFQKGAKSTQKIGVEFEKLGVDSVSHDAIPYERMAKFLEKLSEFEDYKRIFNNSQGENIIGLKNKDAQISLEPGSQFELSLNPQDDLKTLDLRIKAHNNLTSALAQDFNITWIGCGLQPFSTYEDIKIIPKKRYEFMSEYLPKVASLPLVMMRETAGIQVAIDYENENDAIEKLRLSLKLSPIISACFANSPIRNGKLSGYKSFRAKSWTATDNERCGLISEKLFDKKYPYSFKDYVDTLCKTQMIFLNKNNTQVAVNNFTFEDFLNNGFEEKMPDIEDFEQHASLFFTDSRLKNYIEIRNHDCQKNEYIMCIPAFWKGIMYNKDAMCAIDEVLKSFEYFDFAQMRRETPLCGIDYKIKNYHLSEIAKEIFNIAYFSLKKTDEEKYLEAILELIEDNLTPADVVIKNYEKMWQGNAHSIIKYSQL